MRNCAAVIGVILTLMLPTFVVGEEPAVVSELKITTLSTMLTEFRGVGEWGYAALIEADGHTVLFDTGERPDTVLENAAELGIDLSRPEHGRYRHPDPQPFRPHGRLGHLAANAER
jgi:7,8-dihydropterin-6-yl-methyl-4-(beta-D-ribofuranosyl)aminobenzene 5'-phosphate synthase